MAARASLRGDAGRRLALFESGAERDERRGMVVVTLHSLQEIHHILEAAECLDEKITSNYAIYTRGIEVEQTLVHWVSADGPLLHVPRPLATPSMLLLREHLNILYTTLECLVGFSSEDFARIVECCRKTIADGRVDNKRLAELKEERARMEKAFIDINVMNVDRTIATLETKLEDAKKQRAAIIERNAF